MPIKNGYFDEEFLTKLLKNLEKGLEEDKILVENRNRYMGAGWIVDDGWYAVFYHICKQLGLDTDRNLSELKMSDFKNIFDEGMAFLQKIK